MKPTSESRIGLALGSGAAKGFAHIGVLRVLGEMGIRPHVIAGTSMGAFVGAAYAAGELDRLEAWARKLDNWKVFSLLDINWTLGGGVIGGTKPFRAFFEELELENIEELPLPFTAVATDLHSGQEIWLQKGNLQNAVSASCSIPGLLSPKSLSGRWLVDGAVVNPVPVDVCRAMGATTVIAIDVTEDSAPRLDREQGEVRSVISETSSAADEPILEAESEEITLADSGHYRQNEVETHGVATGFSRLVEQGREHINHLRHRREARATPPGMFDTMRQAMEILERRHKRVRMMGSPPDVLILPKVGAIGGNEYARAAEAIELGEKEARRLRTWIEDMVARG
ncbi:patatin-like phospholipase family protein [Microbulbifer hydrolyticus]|uniref:NTE family protein n=1 Tax=Microbulbifer hydrolyticus TaxID=48074 RepID=A0A6P1TA67_9GAMM|nr:patatin-like phospholipase family protein [Microbulbifer hydrolyticus]MBB5211742.1 NTE family protein [Microbulbifer hydrolyticus]QHQ37532.1 patatin-like phospholipase RssA [Microbulbifer hydrolyticus]